ncbi:Pyr-redox-2 domain-containing protein [Mycena chlorophos]|uniref:Pyr-redox-2 domain-containing protein n=1 Tax=Mycena chlorophos TaxID=658473 RepID=A0A8H6TKU9_MYCCL|nr:Pyr-redox-2 domain-containing protein [Mycena chlorophos]
MALDTLRFISKIISQGFPILFTLLGGRIAALVHRATYTPYNKDGTSKRVVVLGASYAGIHLAERLAETLPSGWRVVLVEKSDKFVWQWLMPRFAAAPGLDRWAPFIPYTGVGKGRTVAPGSIELLCGEATEVSDMTVTVGGKTIPWDMLVFATGCTQSGPGAMTNVQDMASFQATVAKARRVAVVGGGAVGVELVADIKSFFPDKELVRIYHSRDRLLPMFGPRLAQHAEAVLKNMGVEVVLGQRPEKVGKHILRTAAGNEEFDLIIPCVGQRPNSGFLANIASKDISATSGHILVQPTLQTPSNERIFAVGDVAASGGPKMGRAATAQTEIAVKNIVAIANGRKATHAYKPKLWLEGGIKLQLGKGKLVIYAEDESENALIEGKVRNDDLGIRMAWWRLGVRYQEPA